MSENVEVSRQSGSREIGTAPKRTLTRMDVPNTPVAGEALSHSLLQKGQSGDSSPKCAPSGSLSGWNIRRTGEPSSASAGGAAPPPVPTRTHLHPSLSSCWRIIYYATPARSLPTSICLHSQGPSEPHGNSQWCHRRQHQLSTAPTSLPYTTRPLPFWPAQVRGRTVRLCRTRTTCVQRRSSITSQALILMTGRRTGKAEGDCRATRKRDE